MPSGRASTRNSSKQAQTKDKSGRQEKRPRKSRKTYIHTCLKCDTKIRKPYDHIVLHIEKELKISRYSCKFCVYSSSDLGLVTNHGKTKHGTEKCVIHNRREIRDSYDNMREACFGDSKVGVSRLSRQDRSRSLSSNEEESGDLDDMNANLESSVVLDNEEEEEVEAEDQIGEEEPRRKLKHRKIYTCVKCNKPTNRVYDHVVWHIAKEMKIYRYGCKFCEFKTTCLRYVVQHGKNKHGTQKCVHCYRNEIRENYEEMKKACFGDAAPPPVIKRRKKVISSSSEDGNETDEPSSGHTSLKPLLEKLVVFDERATEEQSRSALENSETLICQENGSNSMVNGENQPLMSSTNALPIETSLKVSEPSPEATENDGQNLAERITSTGDVVIEEAIDIFEGSSSRNVPIQAVEEEEEHVSKRIKLEGISFTQQFYSSPIVSLVPQVKIEAEHDDIFSLDGSNFSFFVGQDDVVEVPDDSRTGDDDLSPYFVKSSWSDSELLVNIEIVAVKMGLTRVQINAIRNILIKNKMSVDVLLFDDENLSCFFEPGIVPIAAQKQIVKILTAMRFQSARED